MRKPTTGEPYAGEPHVRFGGRGGESLSYPIIERATANAAEGWRELAMMIWSRPACLWSSPEPRRMASGRSGPAGRDFS